VSDRLRVALLQLNGAADVDDNLDEIAAAAADAKAGGADLLATPEMSDRMGLRSAERLAVAEPEAAHPAIPAVSALAQTHGLWIALGSIAVRRTESAGAPLANRSLLFRPDGAIAARYDKIHMFDADVGDGRPYRESATFEPGGRAVLADTPWGGLGLSICYDLRAPQLYRALAQAGARLLMIPAAFTVPTGEAHWRTLLRARAIETGCIVLAAAQTGAHADGRATYGHSLVIAPWGEILAEAGAAPTTLFADLDLTAVDAARRKVPALRADRAFSSPVRAAEPSIP